MPIVSSTRGRPLMWFLWCLPLASLKLVVAGCVAVRNLYLDRCVHHDMSTLTAKLGDLMLWTGCTSVLLIASLYVVGLRRLARRDAPPGSSA